MASAIVSFSLALLSTLPAIVIACIASADPQERIAIALFGASGAFLGQLPVLQAACIVQQRPWALPIPGTIQFMGIAFAAAFTSDVALFALSTYGFRALSSVVGYLCLELSIPTRTETVGLAREGGRFAPLDIVNLMSEQLPVFLISFMLTRDELGLLGLARQLLTVADTPGWSFLSSRYPELVRSPARSLSALRTRNERLALVASIFTIALSVLLSLSLYRQPAVILLTVASVIPLVYRYANNLYDLTLRASGNFAVSLRLSVVKLLFSVGAYFVLTYTFGLIGAAVAGVILSIFSGITYGIASRQLFPDLPPFRIWRP